MSKKTRGGRAADKQVAGTWLRLRLPKAVISAFIFFHLVAIFFWAVPLNTLLRTAFNERISPYMIWSGLWQSWDMFAPNPRITNIYLEAEITLQDGQQRIWKFPRMDELGLVKRYFQERYRKWANDNVRLDINARLWPDIARYIARLHYDPSNPPQSIKLIRYWSDIPPPAAPGEAQLPNTWNHYIFYTYQTAPTDFL